ncbi:MAG TPA: ABC transporter permease subunit [Candidatus Sulfomarinibacteraceae bacterium]|nr:ABC transporter permease subunit [Candidatus Sulfomarinibacteraceae bacterium]
MKDLRRTALADDHAHPRQWPTRRGWWLLLFVLALVWALWQAGVVGRDLINEGGWVLMARFFRAALQPALQANFLQLTAQATLTTLAYAVAGAFFSVLIGGAGALLSSELWWQSLLQHGRQGVRRPVQRAPWLAVRALLAVPRGIHELLWGLLLLNVFGLDPLTAILAIAIPYGAITAKVFAEMLDEAPREPYYAVLNSGATLLHAFLYTLVPQTLPDLLSYAFYRFECAIRAAAVLGIIGAGGLGYQILLSLQSLRYQELWTLFYALVLLTGLADVWSSLLRRRLSRGSRRAAATDWEAGARNSHAAPQSGGGGPDRLVRASLLLAAALIPLSFWYVGPDFGKLWDPRSAHLLQEIAAQAWPPRLAPDFLHQALALSGKTLAMSILAATLAALGGMVLSFPAANNFLLPGGLLSRGRRSPGGDLWRYLLWGSARLLLLFMRAIPAPIWALVLLFVFFPGILPGALALAIYNMGILGRLMAEVVENQPPQPLHALQATGASGGQLFLYGSLPLALPRFLAYGLYRWEIAIRATVIVGLVGAGGLGRELTQQLSRFDYRSVVVTLALYIALTFMVDLISAGARRAWREG